MFSILPICIYIFLYFILFRSIVLDYDIAINNLRQEDQIFIGGSLGNYSLAGFEMILRRHVSHYIINYYLPSGLFVVVSWISFLVNPEVIPGRMTLLVTIFLVLINIFNTIQTNSPKAEGLTGKTICMRNFLRAWIFIFYIKEKAISINCKNTVILCSWSTLLHLFTYFRQNRKLLFLLLLSSL